MILKHVSDNLNPYLKENGNNKLVLGVSGGVDSIVLLDVLNKLKEQYCISISLIHINYGIHPKAQLAEDLCYDLASKYNIDIASKAVDLKSSNFEASARDFRYNMFNEYSKKNSIDYILTAHHKDDQIETLQMKFLDGSDWVSFLGIRKKYGNIIRPMLNITKKEILMYANNQALSWIEDSSNTNINYRRNNIRLNVIPEIIKNNPGHIDELMQKHYNAIKKISLLKDKMIFFRNEYIIESHPGCIIISNKVIDIEDRISFKIFYQDLCQKYFNCGLYSTKKHWKQFYLFVLNSRVHSLFDLNKDIRIIKKKEFHYIYTNNLPLSKINKIIKQNEYH
ncbi:MAG: tRNA lysidine(34) synthetase TilS [Candidatus Marinimicrobia bacterium]|nr:tRNA lysidine(34) synthetase TilS [Candidatus Neomarinimicrobiota bacterium]|tara:strand:+ start:24715 stop:25725 length:1011 start_codon:yes stop_codon:yes gene_type:complete